MVDLFARRATPGRPNPSRHRSLPPKPRRRRRQRRRLLKVGDASPSPRHVSFAPPPLTPAVHSCWLSGPAGAGSIYVDPGRPHGPQLLPPRCIDPRWPTSGLLPTPHSDLVGRKDGVKGMRRCCYCFWLVAARAAVG